jgi:hypothetical protein
MAPRVGRNSVIIHPLAVNHVPHLISPFQSLNTFIRILTTEKGPFELTTLELLVLTEKRGIPNHARTR